MASTSTNKQPLLVDNVLHAAVDLNTHKAAINTETPGKLNGANTAEKLIDCIGRDGAVIESITRFRVTRKTSMKSIYT